MNWSIRTQTIAGLATVAALFLGVGVFGTMSSLAGAVVSTGQIELETHAQILQHPDGGVVAAIPVRDGDRVKAGDVLLTLEGSSLLADRAILMSQFHELEARAARLRAEATDRTAVIYPATLQDAATADPSVSEGLVGQEAVFTAALRTFTATIDGTREQ